MTIGYIPYKVTPEQREEFVQSYKDASEQLSISRWQTFISQEFLTDKVFYRN